MTTWTRVDLLRRAQWQDARHECCAHDDKEQSRPEYFARADHRELKRI